MVYINSWKEIYDKKKRPGINELSAYLSSDVMVLFSEYANHLKRQYGLNCAPVVYTINNGWVFRFGRNNMYLINNIKIIDDSFYVESICVNNRDSLKAAFNLADTLYAGGFSDKLAGHSAQKSAEQYERTKIRLAREKKKSRICLIRLTRINSINPGGRQRFLVRN